MSNYLFLFLLLPACLQAQDKSKIDKLDFCGWRYESQAKIRSNFQEQFDFLNVHDGDTIVDIGAQSGTYEGCLLAVTNFKNLSFVLVDIDSSCMNQQKLNNVVDHYSNVKGEPIKANFKLVHNTVDSLWLPTEQYQKAWIMNTLHEITDKAKMVRDINFILKKGGEIVVLELGPRKEGQLHGGCNKPLMRPDELNALFTANGFLFRDQIVFKKKKTFDIVLQRYVKQ